MQYLPDIQLIIKSNIKSAELRKEKQQLHEIATDGNHFLFFEHDLNIACGSIVKNERGRVQFEKQVSLNDIV